MVDAARTVFISYRRTVSSFIAHAIFLDLHAHGYNVFMDADLGGKAGHFEFVLRQIETRQHFVVILTPGALELCRDTDDEQRRELERAIDLKRNIVPVLTRDLRLNHPIDVLSGKLAVLAQLPALDLPVGYFDVAMQRLRTQHLDHAPPLAVTAPTPEDSQQVQACQLVLMSRPSPTPDQFRAEYFFDRSFSSWLDEDYDATIMLCTQTIELDPSFDLAYLGRAEAYMDKGMVKEAIDDYSAAIQLVPTKARVFAGRARAYRRQKRWLDALDDLNTAIALEGQNALFYNDRGNLFLEMRELTRAIDDFSRATYIAPKYADGYHNRGVARSKAGDLSGARLDYDQALEVALVPNVKTYKNRGIVRKELGFVYGALADLATYLDEGGGQMYGDGPAVEEMIKNLARGLGGQH